MSNDEWSKILPKDVYDIARKKGTERPFTGKYNSHFEEGTYYCAACGNPLFKSDAKFESSCGWPSFFEPINEESIFDFDKAKNAEKKFNEVNETK